MATTSERDGTPTLDETSNEVLMQRALARCGQLLERDEALQGSSVLSGALEAIRSCPSSIERLAKACELYADRPAVAHRAFEIAAPGPGGDGAIRYLPSFQALTYRELWARVEAFASGLREARLADTGALVGIYGFGSVDWAVADFACLYLGAVSVPLQSGMSPADLEHIVVEAELSSIVCSAPQLALVEAILPRCPSVRSVVVMDLIEEDRAARDEVARRAQALGWRRDASLVVRTMREVERLGEEQGIAPLVRPQEIGGDPLMTLMYTSGSTGTPKGAMFAESLWREHWDPGIHFARMPEIPYVGVSYNPLNHAAGRHQLINSVVRGGVTHFVLKSDMSSLFEDIRLVRPTTLFLVPRVAEMIHQELQSELVRRAPDAEPGSEARRRIEAQVTAEMRGTTLGDRLLALTVGSAPTPPEVVSFLRRCFEVPVFDGYGSTEAGLLTFDERIDTSNVTAFKLVDVPELGYRTTDTPYPRGELHVKTAAMIPGYYKNERATKDLFDADGLLNTGDIVAQRGPDRLVWIDRAKNILKLSQGEFVATSRLEGLYTARSPLIQQAYLYGNSRRSYLLAVIVPEAQAAAARLRSLGMRDDEASIKQLIRDEINRVAAEEQLHGFEIPRDFILELAPFTRENGLLTESEKPSRPKLKARYGARLEELYAAMERAQEEELRGLRRDDGGAMSAAEKVKKAMEVTLGLSDIDPERAQQSFLQLGGDSLSAVRLSTVLQEISGVALPVGALLDPTRSVRALVAEVESALSGKPSRTRATFAEVHGAGATTVRADDLRIDRFLSKDELEAAVRRTARAELPPEARVALLTGANGFLGRFLLLELLDRLPAEGGKVYCLVRAPSDETAFERLREAYRGADPALDATFARLASSGRLVVLAGDLMTPRFGLPDDTYASLCAEVDCVVHNGALVNHAFSYPQLFEPNVLGTVEVIRFALERRLKSVSYVSTVGVVSGLDRRAAVCEDEDPRSLWRERPIDSGYAVGYATSKWASEVLLRDAHERLGLPVTTLRPSAILAHRRFRGQVNVTDWLTRLLCGVVYTGLAPRAFYAGGRASRAGHVDGLPVDVVARSIVAISLDRPPGGAGAPGYATYHVVNPYRDDGISLDVIVDWLQTAGYQVERVPDYAAWYQAFRARLSSLAEPERQHSPLPIIHQWETPAPARDHAVLDSTRHLERLAAVAARRGEREIADLPHLDERFIHKYLDDMVVLHLIEPPALQGASAAE